MNPATGIRFLEIVQELLTSPELMRLAVRGDMKKAMVELDAVEQTLVRYGFSRNERRATCFSRLFLDDLQKLDAAMLDKRVANVEVVLDDLERIVGFLDTRRVTSPDGRYLIEPGPDVQKEFDRNITNALKTRDKTYRQGKPHWANNALLGRLLRDPDYLIGPFRRQLNALVEFGYEVPDVIPMKAFLENRIRAGTKIDDIHCHVTAPNLMLDVDGVAIDLTDLFTLVNVSGDSKFLVKPWGLGSGKTLYQQMALTMGDKVGRVYEVMLRLEYTSPADFEKVLNATLPLLLQHYVVLPPDIGVVSTKMMTRYAGDAKAAFREMLDIDLEFGEYTDGARIDIVHRVADGFFDQHFGKGDFVLRHEMSYHDLSVK